MYKLLTIPNIFQIIKVYYSNNYAVEIDRSTAGLPYTHLPGLISDETTKHLPIDSEYFILTNLDNAGIFLFGPPSNLIKLNLFLVSFLLVSFKSLLICISISFFFSLGSKARDKCNKNS